jgi:hypothetical protein
MNFRQRFLSFLARCVREVSRHVLDAFNERVSGMSSEAHQCSAPMRTSAFSLRLPALVPYLDACE